MDMEPTKQLQFDYTRRFGVEMEVNASDGKDHLPFDKMPEGIQIVGNVVSKTLEEYVEIKRWGPTHWDRTNGHWIVKPDGSCGIEVCSPICKGWVGLSSICVVADALKEAKIKADHRCSLHQHVDISDLTIEELASVITYWIKCEPVFMDAFPEVRKNNKYCQYIGLCDWIRADTVMTPQELVRFLGVQKYTSINTFHLNKGKRPTIEFRIADNNFCLNSYSLKNWCRLVIHFIEMTKGLPPASKYSAGDPWSSYLWLDPRDVFKVLGWDGSYELSPGMKQTRNWFCGRMVENLGRSSIPIQSLSGRRIAHTQVFDMVHKYTEEDEFQLRDAITPANQREAVYGAEYRI